MKEHNIISITADNDIFNSSAYLDDKLMFNYIEGAKALSDTILFSDSKHAIICRKHNHDNVWIWTDNDSYNNAELVIDIAKTVSSFNIKKPQFFTKPNIAQIFSDMYALVSSDLDYHIKDEFSLGAYKYVGSKNADNKEITIQQYSKKHYTSLAHFYNDLAVEFSWEDGRAEKMCEHCEKLSTYLLLKSGEILSLCSVSDNTCETAYICSIATKKEHRNKGYGSFVTAFAAESSMRKNKEIMVYTNKGNKSAQAALKKAGFSLIGDIHLIKS